MRSLRRVLLASLTVGSFWACTYKADPQDGVQICSDDGLCPSNYQCWDDWRCHYAVGGSGGGGLFAAGGTVGFGGWATGGSIIAASGGSVAKLVTGGTSTHVSSVAVSSGGFLAATGGVVGLGGRGTGGAVMVAAGGIMAKPGTGGTLAYTATFQYGQASGPITGYGWIALGPLDSVTEPTCGAFNSLITSTASCNDVTNWNSANALCVSGYIPALPVVPTADDYNNNWGIQIGVNATAAFGIVGRAYSTISASISGVPTSWFRLELHRYGDAATTTYCYDGLTSGMQVPLTGFNTACWTNTGTWFTTADAPNIDKVGVQVSSLPTAIMLTNMCLNSITFGN